MSEQAKAISMLKSIATVKIKNKSRDGYLWKEILAQAIKAEQELNAQQTTQSH